MEGNDNKLEGIFTDHTQHITNKKKYNKPEIIIIDHKQEKIKDIFYGLPKNPIKWPKMKPINLPGGYFNITEALYDYAKMSKCGNVKIPSGYMGDHDRCKMIFNAYKKIYDFEGESYRTFLDNPRLNFGPHNGLYKEIYIKMEDGKEYYLSKWKDIRIINWIR